ncbi:MAG: acetate--CoA ligase family protein [Syntrophobacter sp.]
MKAGIKSLDAILSPRSVAVVGASNSPGKVGHDIFKNILKCDFQGTLYPVNPKAQAIKCVKAYGSVKELPEQVDLGIIIVPPKAAQVAVNECAEKGVKGVVIVSAGFKEVGEEGRKIEDAIAATCREAGMRLIGPNCLGVINPHPGVRLNASFSTRMPAYGHISFISQSGALCTAVLDFAADRNFGFSKFISIGNKADVDELDLLRYLHDDEDTEIILIYLEELKRSAEFIETVKEITSGERPTPVVVIKSGRTSEGARAAASHTGALAGSEGVYDAFFEQSGIIRADSIEDLFNFAGAFAARKIPRGNKVAIVTNAGGPGIVCTDMTVSSGLELARFKDDTIEALASHLPSAANLHNPVDVIGDATHDRYALALDAVIKDEGVDGALVILTPQSMTNALGTAEAVVKIARSTSKPILCCFMGIIDVSAGVNHLQERGVPVYRFPEHAAKSFASLYRYSRWLSRQHLAEFNLVHDKKRADEIITECISKGNLRLGELVGNELLRCYGFPVLPTKLARTKEEAKAHLEVLGGPVVMKIMSPQILHKSDAKGVMLGIASAGEAMAAFEQIIENAKAYAPDAHIEGVLMQKMAPRGEEVIVGMTRFDRYGPLLMFGLGGIFVELFKDVIFRIAPIGRDEARRMVTGIKGSALLNGFRGKAPSDTEAVERALVSLSRLVINHPEIRELDINPLIVHEKGKGATVADCRIILAPAEKQADQLRAATPAGKK